MTSTAPPDRTDAASEPVAAGGVEAATRTDPLPRGPDRMLAAARRPLAVDAAVAVLFVLFAAWLTAGLWPDPGTRVLALNPEDQTLYEWFLANDARILLGDFGLVTDRLNAPDGINLMANTTVIALGALFAPVTLAFGSETTFALIAALNLALTGLAWYLLFARALRAHRLAALFGGAFCGFAPGMLSQNNAHLHMTAQWLVPVMVWCVVRMVQAADDHQPAGDRQPADAHQPAGDRQPADAHQPAGDRQPADDHQPAGDRQPGGGPDPRRGRRLVGYSLALAAVVSVQVFIGEEVLFLTALTLALMTIVYGLLRRDLVRRAGRRFAGGLLLAAVTAGAVLAYPLWMQFAGPQGVSNGLFSPDYFSADLASWPAISPMSVAGSEESIRLSTGPAEYNTFLGWPLIIATLACAAWLWRRPVVVASAVAGLIMAAFSLGPNVVVDGVRTAIPGPYKLLQGLPVVDGALPMRFALALIPLVALILVLALDRALADRERVVRVAVPVAITAALLPIAPAPVATAARPPVPAYITDGHWRDCVKPGGVLVPVPLPTPPEPWPMRWAAHANAAFALPEGFFIGPYGARGKAAMGTFKQPTSALLEQVAQTGQAVAVDDGRRQQARADLAFWGASCVVLADGTANAEPLLATVEGLLGPGTRVADAWTWRV